MPKRRGLPNVGASYYLELGDTTQENFFNVVDYAGNVLAADVTLDRALELVQDWESGEVNPYMPEELTTLLEELQNG